MEKFAELSRKKYPAKESRFGAVMRLVALVFVFGALPSQIWYNYQTQTVGWTWFMIILSPSLYVARIGYAWAIWQEKGVKPGYLMIPDVCGVFFGTGIVAKTFYYHSIGIPSLLSFLK